MTRTSDKLQVTRAEGRALPFVILVGKVWAESYAGKETTVEATAKCADRSRREFVQRMVPTSAFLCFGIGGFLGDAAYAQDTGASKERHKFEIDSGMTYEQVLRFAFRSWYIRYLKGMEAEMGKTALLKMLRTVGSNIYARSIESQFEYLEDRTVEALINGFWVPMMESDFWNHVMTIHVDQRSRSAGIVRMTECLVAKTFREADAADIGYAAICHADHAVASAFNPRIKLTRDECLMNGDSRCHFEYLLV